VSKDKVLVAVKRHAKTQCANFDGYNSCFFREVCKYYQENMERCSYYEHWVLPGDTSLEAKYHEAFNLTKVGDAGKIEKALRRKQRRKGG